MGFRLVPTSITLDDLEWRNSPYFAFFADFDFFAGQICRSSQWLNIDLYCLPVPVFYFWP